MLTPENERTERPSPNIIHKVAAEASNPCGKEDKGTGSCLRFGDIPPTIRVSYSTKVGLYKTNWMC
jgi:hypothetical protein